MDPLSVSASIIAVLQATSTVISVCYDFRSALKNAPWGLIKVIDEAKELRHVLEMLIMLAEQLEGADAEQERRLPALRLLCEPEKGPLASCLREMTSLEQIL